MLLCVKMNFDDSPTCKRQRRMDDLFNSDPVDPDIIKTAQRGLMPIRYEEMTRVNHPNCYACNHITPASIRENKYHYNLMKLYTDNSTSICPEAIYKLIKEYYDQELKPQTEIEWSIDAIKEHFLTHTMFPTDEILRQINITQGVRRYLMDSLIEKSDDEEPKFNMNNIRMLVSLNKELRALRQLKGEIPSMVGFNQELNY